MNKALILIAMILLVLTPALADNRTGTYDKGTCGVIKLEIVNDNSGGGCTPVYECSDWSACSNDIQTRTCKDIYECAPRNDPPETERRCGATEQNVLSENIVIQAEQEPEQEEILTEPTTTTQETNQLTGAVTGGGAGSWIWVTLLGSLIVGMYGLYFVKRK